MSKFCNYCGTQLDDSATFCANCGAQLETKSEAPKASAPQSTPTSKVQLEAPLKGGNFIADNKNKLIGAGIAVAVVIIIFFVVSNIISGFGYKGPIKNYYKAINKESGEIYLKTMPEFKIEYKDIDEDDATDDMEDLYDNYKDKVGKDPKLTYEILTKTSIPEKTLEGYEESYNETYEDELDDDCEIEEGYIVLIKVTAKGSRETEEFYATHTVLNINGDWYLK